MATIVKNSEEGNSHSGIPEAIFLEDVDAFMQKVEDQSAEIVLRQLDEQHSKYKFMEANLTARKRRLRNQVPDIQKSLEMIEVLKTKKEAEQDMETNFLLSALLYSKAKIPPTSKVCLWLGANVMLEYSLEDAEALLKKNLTAALKQETHVQDDLDFLRDQMTTTEVNMARVYNWDVKRRQAAKATAS
nr:EOG090X0IRH [Triops cancriformis]